MPLPFSQSPTLLTAPGVRPAVFALAFAVLTLWGAGQEARAEERWRRVQTEQIEVVGDADERDLRRVAILLETFRSTLSSMHQQVAAGSAVGTRVLVLKGNKQFRQIAPLLHGKPDTAVSAFFLSGETHNYIALTAKGNPKESNRKDRVVLDGYYRFLLRNRIPAAPLWLEEGLAKYFSSFALSKSGTEARVGGPIGEYVSLLRSRNLLPLPALFAVNRDSPIYHDPNRRVFFEAQCWALVRYLNERINARKLPELAGLPASGLRPEEAFPKDFNEAFKKAFEKAIGIALPVFEREFTQQVRSGGIHSSQQITLRVPARLENSFVTETLSEAEAQYYLGDFLLNSRNAPHRDAERFLLKSIRLDPNLSAAHALLGKIYMQRKEFTEAEKYLTRAAQADPPSHLAHYYRALLYSLDPSSGAAGGAQPFRFRENYPPETEAKIRAELEEATRLEPDFPDSYYLLAQITLATDGDPNIDEGEAVRLLKHALRLAPGRERYTILLAQAYLQGRDIEEARRILAPLARAAADRQARHEARRLLKLIEEKQQ